MLKKILNFFRKPKPKGEEEQYANVHMSEKRGM
jgi:hypothetical protein